MYQNQILIKLCVAFYIYAYKIISCFCFFISANESVFFIVIIIRI